MSKNITTTEHRLSKKDKDLAAEIEALDSGLDKTMLTICLKTAEGCKGKGSKSQESFLAAALPKRARGTRSNILYAGEELLTRRRVIEELDYGWSSLTEIHSLPSGLKDWAYEEKRSVKEIRAKKKEPTVTPEAKADEQGKEEMMTEEEASVFNEMVDLIEEQTEKIDHLSLTETTTSENHVRRHQRPKQSICRTGGAAEGAIQRSEWFTPDHIEDREAHAVYQQILGLLSDAAELCEQWQPQQRICKSFWDEIAGHCAVIDAFASCRVADTQDAESDSDTADGVTVTVTAERA